MPRLAKYDLSLVTWLVKIVLSDEERRNLRCVALELYEIRRLVIELAERLVNLSDKELLKILDASENDLKENQVENYKEILEKQVDIAEKEFRR